MNLQGEHVTISKVLSGIYDYIILCILKFCSFHVFHSGPFRVQVDLSSYGRISIIIGSESKNVYFYKD